MRPLHKWQSLNALFYLHYLSPSEVRKSREGGGADLIPSSCTQTEGCSHSVWCLCGGGELQHRLTAQSLLCCHYKITHLVKSDLIDLIWSLFLRLIQLDHESRIESLFFLHTFSTFCSFHRCFVGGIHSIGMANADAHWISIVITFLLHWAAKTPWPLM